MGPRAGIPLPRRVPCRCVACSARGADGARAGRSPNTAAGTLQQDLILRDRYKASVTANSQTVSSPAAAAGARFRPRRCARALPAHCSTSLTRCRHGRLRLHACVRACAQGPRGASLLLNAKTGRQLLSNVGLSLSRAGGPVLKAEGNLLKGARAVRVKADVQLHGKDTRVEVSPPAINK